MIMPRNEFDDLVCSIGTPAQTWDARFQLLRCYDEQANEIRGLNANVSYQKHSSEMVQKQLWDALNRIQALEKAEAVWTREASLLRTALDNTTTAAIQAEAKAEKYYRKVRELEIALRLNCKIEPPSTKEIKEEFSQQPTTLLKSFAEAEAEYQRAHGESKEEVERFGSTRTEYIDIIDEIGPSPSTITWKQVMRLHGRAVELREIARGFESERVRLQSLLHSAVLQADATYAPYRKMVQEARVEVEKMATKLFDTRAALHNLVEACHRADNDGDLSSEIDGSLMDAAWEALK